MASSVTENRDSLQH